MFFLSGKSGSFNFFSFLKFFILFFKDLIHLLEREREAETESEHERGGGGRRRGRSRLPAEQGA